METVKQVSIKHKVPVFGGSTEMVAVGGLYNYGTNYEELGRQTARMLVRVLKGEKPENIAVELPENWNYIQIKKWQMHWELILVS